MTTTTSEWPPCDAHPAHQASLQVGQSCGTSAVPVLPYTVGWKFANVADDVPSPLCVARYSP